MRPGSGLKRYIWEVTKAMGTGEYENTRDEAGEGPTFKVFSCLYSYPSKHAIRSLVFLSPLGVKMGRNTRSVKMTRERPCTIFLPFPFLPAATRWWGLYGLGL